jgi:hypothetical protein
VVVVVVAVVAVVEVEVEVFGLVVVGAMVGCGRVGPGGEVGSGAGAGTLLKEALVAELEVAPVPAPSTRLSPLAVGSAPGSLMVGSTLPAPGPVMSGPASPRGAVVLEGATRSAPASSSHPQPQRFP